MNKRGVWQNLMVLGIGMLFISSALMMSRHKEEIQEEKEVVEVRARAAISQLDKINIYELGREQLVEYGKAKEVSKELGEILFKKWTDEEYGTSSEEIEEVISLYLRIERYVSKITQLADTELEVVAERS
ncbi:hypothetical protein ACFLZZ_04520 [Nanoarchaeota archaeon]